MGEAGRKRISHFTVVRWETAWHPCLQAQNNHRNDSRHTPTQAERDDSLILAINSAGRTVLLIYQNGQ